MAKISKKIFSVFISYLFYFSNVSCLNKTNALNSINFENYNQNILESHDKENSESNKIKNWVIGLVAGYASLNILSRALTQIALFFGAFQTVNKNNSINYDNQIVSEEILENINDEPVVIGKKYFCNISSSSSLKNINIIFFNGNGGSVLNDEMHLGPDGKLVYLIKKGATVYTIDYTGYGNRKKFFGPFAMSENSIFQDGENIFNYVLKESKNKKIIIYGYSLGGQVAIHVWRYIQENNLEDKLAGVILHSPLNNFNKVAGKIFKPLEYLLNLMLINLNKFKEFEKLKATKVPSYWYSGYTEDSSEFVDLKTTIYGDPDYNISKEEATEIIINKLKDKGIENARVVIKKISHMEGYSIISGKKEAQYEINEFKKFIKKIEDANT